jgi:hypothetical protein
MAVMGHQKSGMQSERTPNPLYSGDPCTTANLVLNHFFWRAAANKINPIQQKLPNFISYTSKIRALQVEIQVFFPLFRLY